MVGGVELGDRGEDAAVDAGMALEVCLLDDAEENEIAAQNLDLPPPESKRTPVEEHVKEQ